MGRESLYQGANADYLIGASPNAVAAGNEEGDFVLASTQPISTAANYVTVADMDGDSSNNIVVVDAQEDRVYILP